MVGLALMFFVLRWRIAPWFLVGDSAWRPTLKGVDDGANAKRWIRDSVFVRRIRGVIGAYVAITS